MTLLLGAGNKNKDHIVIKSNVCCWKAVMGSQSIGYAVKPLIQIPKGKGRVPSEFSRDTKDIFSN